MNATELRSRSEVAVPSITVSIVIPTYRRGPSLLRALASCTAQRPAPEAEIVVVDNCPHGSAREAVEAFAAQAPLPVRYAHEPSPGVAAARNTGVALARGTFVVFLDDDEEASPQWLDGLLRTQQALEADVVFGPVLARAEQGASGARPVVAEALRTFSRQFPEPTGPLPPAHHAKLGTGNSLFRRSLLLAQRFDPALGLTGGEDTAILKPLIREGRRMGWCREAVVAEYLPQQRLTLRTLIARRFSGGQARTATCATTRPSQPVRAVMWMAAGAAQAVACSGVAVAVALVEPDVATHYLCSAAAGAGKVLWMWPFRLRRYPSLKERLP